MISRGIEKYSTIITAANLEARQCMYLGIMGMARTMDLVRHIANHKQFESLLQFEIFIMGGIKKVFYNDLEIEKEVRDGIEICNALIPILDEYDYSDCINEQDEAVMSIAYSLVEEWYYFIGLLSLPLDNEKCNRMRFFVLTLYNLIDLYLHNKYDGISINEEHHKEVNFDMIVQFELDTIDEDISFVQNKDNLENIKLVEERVNKLLFQRFILLGV